MSLHERYVNGLRVKIVTSHNRPPIPDREYDWSAVTDDYEPGDPIGNGETEEAAILNLIGQLEEEP